jgi:hypothetical protein
MNLIMTWNPERASAQSAAVFFRHSTCAVTAEMPQRKHPGISACKLPAYNTGKGAVALNHTK